MLVVLGVTAGATWGAYLARKRGGNRLDGAQYSAGFAIALGLLGAFAATILLRRPRLSICGGAPTGRLFRVRPRSIGCALDRRAELALIAVDRDRPIGDGGCG